jgi:hypothetical protein
MADLKEQRVCIKVCFKLGKTASRNALYVEAIFMWQQFGPDKLTIGINFQKMADLRRWWRSFGTDVNWHHTRNCCES